jgi:uncharacterized protein with FMN-binding domain
MKRAILVGTGTIAGVAAVLALNPDPAVQTATATTVTSSGSGSSSSGSSGSSSGSSSSGSSSTDGTYTGDAVDVGRGYGTIQVEVTVENGRIVDIQALAIPQNDNRSYQISSRAWPYLVDEAITAQSADIAGVSGASYTSWGFAESLASALAQAGI